MRSYFARLSDGELEKEYSRFTDCMSSEMYDIDDPVKETEEYFGGEIGNAATTVDVELVVVSVSQGANCSFSLREKVRVISMLSAVADRIGEDVMRDILIKSADAVDRLVADTGPIGEDEASEASDKAAEAYKCAALRMCELYEAAAGTQMEDTVVGDLAAMFPGLVFMASWDRVMWDTYMSGYVELRLYERDEDKTEFAAAVAKAFVNGMRKFSNGGT